MSRYIDAEKVAEELSKVPWYKREDEKQAVRMVKEFSAADVQEVKHGRWEWNNKDEYFYSCSNCGHEAYGNTAEIASGFYNYCPRCGAKMRSIDDEVADLPMEAYYNKDWKTDEVTE